MKYTSFVGSSDKKFRNYSYNTKGTNVKGNYKGGKSLVKYSRVTAARGKIKTWATGMNKNMSGQQRFLGKTLPKTLFKVAKWGFRNPITATALAFAPKVIGKAYKKADKGYSFAKFRNWDKKGRKII